MDVSPIDMLLSITGASLCLSGVIAYVNAARVKNRWMRVADLIRKNASFQETLDDILDFLSREINAAVWAVYRYEEQGDCYQLVGSRGSMEKERLIPPAPRRSPLNPLLSAVPMHPFPPIEEEELEAPPVLSRSPKLGVCGIYRDRGAPILNLPLGVGDRPVGLVQAFPVEDSPHVRAFEKDWRPLGESLGRLLDFADRLDAYQTRLDDLEVSNQLGESLLGSIFNARDFMSKLLEVILLNTRSSVVRLDMTDETEMSESDEENVFVVQSGDQPVVQKPQLWQAVKSELIRSRYLSREGHPELLESIRASFVAGVPVDLPGRGTGMLFLARDQRQGYEERELMIARVFAEKIELFFQTASTYRLASDAYRGTVQLLVEMMDAREAQTLGHSNRVMLWSVSVGKIFGLSESEMETLRWAALFHDVGMCGIDEGIQKTQGRLADDQMDRIRQHPRLGALICDPLHLPLPVSPAILTHHERWDGRGYPNGLKGEQIPLLGRIIALAEVFNAFISPRHYRQALTLEEAAQRVLNESGISLDPSVVQAFLKALASDPVYDFLKIRNGSAALS